MVRVRRLNQIRFTMDLDVRFESNDVGQQLSEVVACGTAVLIAPAS